MAALENIIENLKAWPAKNIVGLFALVFVSVAGMILLLSWINKADHRVLYSNLSEDDAGRIIEELKNRKISYELGSSGTILVSADKLYDLRLELASEGLPQGGGVGFEIFDNTSFTTSEFVQKLNYRRALEGELSRTIRSISGVQQGRVHLVIPDKSMFAFQESKPETSAAVFVTLSKNRKLDDKEVEGIVHLVSSSVEDLSPESITVVDNKGNLLTRPTDDNMMSLSGTQMDYQENFEKNMMAKIVSILEPVVGRGKIRARVSAAFDFTRSERTEEIFDPDGVVVRSEQKSTEKTISGLLGGSGIPGAASNLPGGSSAQLSSSQGQSSKEDEMINYETSKTVTRVVDSPASLERLSVAIIIDGLLASQKGSVDNASQYQIRSEDDIKFYEDIVKKTIGFTEDRGDAITVSVMPFRDMEIEEIGNVEKNYMPLIMTVLKYLIPLVVAFVFFMLILRPLMKSLTKPPVKQTSAPVAAGTAGELTNEIQTKEIPLEKQVVNWANSNPKEAANLVKGWLEE